ncbi:DUF1294 domain-containing protein [Psychrobacter sp. I-STPA6b]|uniref:DUF1294 domain-containing protein n=1 Tax=Psychrobacter sp. I-STPA6b TaxID=2585718 RepID=UPI001D0BF80C|nr:DUF1294 domain-containing protein [Psychrobacter sp. I-STPA6b]
MKQQGVIRKWHDDKGFGFIESQTNESIFFHISDYKPRQRPIVGEQVVFELQQDSQGRWQAKQIQELAFVQQQAARKNKRQRHQDKFRSGQKNRLFIAIGFYGLLLLLAVLGKLTWYVVGWYGVIGVVTFLMYAKDKSAAQNGQWWTPESTLHLLSVLGGWAGAMVAQTYLRHKSQKSEFQVVYYLTVIINLGILLYILSIGDMDSFKGLL